MIGRNEIDRAVMKGLMRAMYLDHTEVARRYNEGCLKAADEIRKELASLMEAAMEAGIGQSTLMAAWHGKSIGLLPMLIVCKLMGAHPLRYLEVRRILEQDNAN